MLIKQRTTKVSLISLEIKLFDKLVKSLTEVCDGCVSKMEPLYIHGRSYPGPWNSHYYTLNSSCK